MTRIKIRNKLHPVLEFNQSQWIKPYVEFNTHSKKKLKAKYGDRDGKGCAVEINEQWCLWLGNGKLE